MNKSESIENLAKALAIFQSQVENPANTATNPYYKSKYAPLSEVLNVVRPVLSKNGLSILQNQITDENGKLGVTTLLMHSSGEFIESDIIYATPEKNTPQGLGSVSTYLRRYQISSVLGIASEDDDDGNSNEGDKKPDKKTDKTPIKNDVPVTTAKEISPEDRVLNAIASIEALATKLQETNVDKKLISEAIKKHNIIDGKAVANYNKIKDIGIASLVYRELQTLEVK